MAKSKLQYWLNEGKDTLTEIIRSAKTDEDIYTTMGISKPTFHKYKKNVDFFNLIKNAKEERIQDNAERLKQLHEDMWKQAHEQKVTEVYQEMVSDGKGGLIPQKGRKVTKTLGGDTTLQIYLDKTYGKNINSEEKRARIELNRARTEVQKLVLSPDIDEATKAKLEAVREILGGVPNVIGETK